VSAHARNSGAVAALALAALVAGGCGPRFAGERLEPSQVAPDLALAGAAGARVSLARPGGRLTLVTFGYTSCPDVCPTTLSDWRRVRGELGADTSAVRFVWVSADWRHDTPARAGAFAAGFDPAFTGVTADSLTLLRLLPVFQAVARYSRAENLGVVVFSHSADSYLLDDTGRIVLQYPFASSPLAIARDIHALARVRRLPRG